jgi:uncharacterized protein
MKKILNYLLTENKDKLRIAADIYYPESAPSGIVVFCHGFKGFKDWGAWHLVAEKFASAGYVFVKFNFSHNGIGLENPVEFTRLDLFAQNNYSKEQEDLDHVINWIFSEAFPVKHSFSKINLIGHSRGGGIVLVKAAEDERVTKVVTLASISTFNRFGSADEIEKWRKEGFKNFPNARTGQNMPIHFSFFEDYLKNRDRLDIEKAVKHMDKPLLIVHGTADEAVGFSHAQRIKNQYQNAGLLAIENANHVFGTSHPWQENHLPEDLLLAVEKTIEFFGE